MAAPPPTAGVGAGAGAGAGARAGVAPKDAPDASPPGKLLSQGAEGRVYATMLYGQPAIVKERFPRSYRHPALDHKLTNRRVVTEARALVRASKLGVRVPLPLYVDQAGLRIYMELVPGDTVKAYLNSDPPADEAHRVAGDVGRAIAVLHSGGLTHGDLTTSNMMVPEDRSNVTLIDFGLSNTHVTPEDMGVDLYVLERAFNSTHPFSRSVFDATLAAYFAAVSNSDAIRRRFEKVRARGRKRTAFG